MTTRLGMVVSLFGAFLAAAVIIRLPRRRAVHPGGGRAGGLGPHRGRPLRVAARRLIQTPLSEQSVILDSKGATIATPYDENRIIVPLTEIAPDHADQAQVAIEDHRFYEHGGADLQGILRAFVSNKAPRVRSPAAVRRSPSSTSRSPLQENALRAGDTAAAKAATAQNYGRKIQELKYAIQLEKTLTKDQILAGLPQPRLLRRPGLRRRGGLPALLRPRRQDAHPRRGRPARRHRAEPGDDRPGQRPGQGPRRAATSCWTGCTN
jgi:hypothetical protein